MITHEVFNQAPLLVDYNTAEYPAIREALIREGASDALDEVDEVGIAAGTAHALDLGDLAEEHPPVLKTHDRYGNRVDEVVYDPAYHELMRTAVGFGLHGAPWRDPRPNAHLIRAAKFSLWQAVDAGHGCPISMTYAAVPALRVDPEQAALYEPLLTTDVYEPGLRAPGTKAGLIAGMSMTEKQGGSDVRANTTTATAQSDGSYRIVGHKWFTSAPMSDILLTLAQAPGGLTCFVLPRVLPDGTLNPIKIQRLKDKLGNHSNASSEVEYENALGWRLGDEGRGVPTIIEMVNNTRLDCTLGTATLMRQSVQQAIHHVAHRAAFGATLIDQPLMRNVVADLAVEAEASTTVALWLAALTDRAHAGDEHAALLRRIGLAVSKYYVCKRGPVHVAEALECLGGNGYVEESRMPRLFRESPLASIWEGTGNVAALDTLRAVAKQPETLNALFDELDSVAGADARLDRFVAQVKTQFANPETLEFRARTVVGDLALALQGALLVRFGHPAVADAFTGSRLGGEWGTVFGTLTPGIDTAAIIERSVPKA
ncbi:acyl-CoA dehydrogenase family protein [Kribbia dieselivorans]|uniref:acyl-CoA dehydrogenase family protein n=1 Tax=Kribbia dieselivorans TaxID=331526 RepID=UPI0008386478|nr:acyl-CoA dehydrogenase family protein [Kribbia dieselivorans]